MEFISMVPTSLTNQAIRLVLKASQNPYSYFSLEDFYGTETCPVTIINEGGQVNLSNGMSFSNCRYLRVAGTGDNMQKYGFKIEDPIFFGRWRIDIHGRSSFLEVQNHFYTS